MEIVNKTAEGTRQYPLHSHKRYEIMHYVKGNGVMRTERGGVDFNPGTVIVMPPNVLHGSVSDDGFVNISIEGDFDGLLLMDSPTVINDLEDSDGARLVQMIWENRYGSEAYLHALCIAYAGFLLQKTKIDNEMTACVVEIIRNISDKAYDPEINVTEMLKQSGFSEDYVRSAFKKETGKTPIEFLTARRIKHACYLIEVYGKTLSLSAIAEACGYTDYIYFSKKFKEYVGVSPREYKK